MIVVEGLTLVVDLVHLLELEHHHVRPRVVTEADRTEYELSARWRYELERGCQRSVLGRRQILENVAEMIDHRGDLLLLALHRELGITSAQLQEEHT